jgi:hypothetical protein
MQRPRTEDRERERERERESSVVAAQRRHVLAVKVQSKMAMVGKGNKPNSTKESPNLFLSHFGYI